MWAVGLTQSVEGHRSKPRGFLEKFCLETAA